MNRRKLAAMVGALPPPFLASGTVLLALGQLIVVMALTRMVDLDATGVYSLALGIVTVVLTLFDLSMRNVLQSRSVAVGFRSFLASRVLASSLALIPFVIAVVLLRSEFALLLLILSVARAADQFGDLYTGFQLNGAGRRRAGISYTLNGVLTPILAIVALALYPNVLAAGIGSVVASLVAGMIYPLIAEKAFLAGRRGAERHLLSTSPASIRLVIRAGLPLGLASSIAAVTAVAPRVLLAALATVESVGVYALVSSVILTAQLPIQVLCQDRLSALSLAVHERAYSRFRRIVYSLLAWTASVWISLVAIVLLLAAQIAHLLTGETSSAFEVALTVFSVLALPSYAAWTMDIVALSNGRFTQQLLGAVIMCVVVIGACLLLIPSFGLLGIAYATALAQVARIGCVGLLIRSELMSIWSRSPQHVRNR